MSHVGQPLRSYTDDERVEAVALALVIGSSKAGDQLGIPRRTVNKWTHRPEFAHLQPETRERIDGLLERTVRLALIEVEKGLQDPRISLRQKAKALEIIGRQAAFMRMSDMWVGMEKLLEEVR